MLGGKNQRNCGKNETEIPTNVAIKLNAQNLFARDNYENSEGKNEISLTYFTFPLTIHTNCITSLKVFICILHITVGHLTRLLNKLLYQFGAAIGWGSARHLNQEQSSQL